MKTKLKKKVFGVPVFVILFMFMFASVVIAAWILQARSENNILGVKAKHLEISTDGGTTWTKTASAFFDAEEMDSGAGGSVSETFHLKTTKSGLASVDFTIVNLQRLDGEGSPVSLPVDAAQDLTKYFYLYDVNASYPAGRIDMGYLDGIAVEESGSPYTVDFFDTDSDKTSDQYEIMINFENTGIEDVDELNGASFTFDFVVEETPAP